MDKLFNQFKPALVVLLALMTVLVDFTSYILSFVADGLFMVAIVAIVWTTMGKEKDKK